MSSRRPYPEKKSREAAPGSSHREPPQNFDAEQGVLASILLEGEDGKADLLAQCRRMHLAPEDFFNTAHQIIFSAMLELDEAGAGVDDITLPDRLNRMDQLKTVGGTPYINELRRRIEVASHAWHWLALVLEKSKRRRLITISGEILERAFDPVALVADSAATSIADLVKLERGAEGDEETVVSVVKQTREMWRRALAGEPSPNRKTISFALPELDEKFEPLCWEDGDELVILCARSGVGKTSLARQIAKHHLFVTDTTAIGQIFLLESKARQLVARMAGLSSEIPYREGLDAVKLKRWRASEKRLRRYKTGATYGTMYAGEDLAHFQSRCEQEEFNSQAEVHSAWLDKIEEAADKRLFVRAHTFDADKIVAQAKATHRLTGRTDFVIIDYLQIVRLKAEGGGNRNGYEVIASIAAKFKELSRALGCPVIVIASVTVDGDGMPELEDLRGSKDAGYAADRIIGVHRPAKDAAGCDQTDDREVKHVQIRQIKARDQGVFTLWAGFRSELTRFEPLDRHYSATSSTSDGHVRGRGQRGPDKAPRAEYGSKKQAFFDKTVRALGRDERPWPTE